MAHPSTDSEAWVDFWDGLTPESEIRMWDFYGGRPWILKHTPRFGKVVEAGCGLGRYVLYLKRLGIDIEGVEFHQPTVLSLKRWARNRGLSVDLAAADVGALPYAPSSLSGYLSFGVIEHFEQGPQQVLQEAYRVLRPGGVAIITVPAFSFSQAYIKTRRTVGNFAKQLLGLRVQRREFFQYWYTLGQLKSFVESAGLKVMLSGCDDLVYALFELGLKPAHLRLYRLASRLNKTAIASIGAQAITISIKTAEQMHCFLCGELRATPADSKKFYLPICTMCDGSPLAEHYRARIRPTFCGAASFEPPLEIVTQRCAYCSEYFETDALFEGYGFARPVCEKCIIQPKVNLDLSSQWVKHIWRAR